MGLMGGKNVIEIVLRAKDEASNSVSGLKKKLASLPPVVQKIAIAAPIAAAAVLALGKAFFTAAGWAGQFNKKVAEVNTLLNADRATIKQMSKDLQDLAVRFGQVDTVMAEAQYNVVSAGFGDVADSLHILEIASRAAIGGVTDVNTAAKVLTQTINAYGLSAKDAEKVAGVLFTTVKGGVTTFEELAGGLGNVTSTAVAAGISFEEVGAAIAGLTKKGIDTRTATTALNALILAIATGGPEVEALGISLDEGLGPALATLGKLSEDGLGPLAELVGNVRAVKAAAALGADGAREFNTQLAAMTGGVKAFNDAYEIMSREYEFQSDRVIAANQKLKQSIGETFIDEATVVKREWADFIDSLAESIPTVEALTVAVTKLTFFPGRVGRDLAESIIPDKTEIQASTIAFDDMGAAMAGAVANMEDLRRYTDPATDAIERQKESLTALATEYGVALEAAKVSAAGKIEYVRKTDEELIAEIEAAIQAAIDEAAKRIEAGQPVQITIPRPTVAAEDDPFVSAFGEDDIADALMPDVPINPWENVSWEPGAQGPFIGAETMVDPEAAAAGEEVFEAWARAAADFQAEQDAIRWGFEDITYGLQGVASAGVEAMLRNEKAAFKFADVMVNVVVKALSEVIAKLLIIRALSFASGLFSIGGIKDGGTIPKLAAGGSIPGAAFGYSVPDGPRGRDSMLIRAMPGEEVINRQLARRMDRFIQSWEQASAASPFGLGSQGGGATIINNMNIARPIGVVDATALGEDLMTTAEKVGQAAL